MPQAIHSLTDLLPHHQAAIQRLSDHLEPDPNVLAVIIAGSLTKGTARPDSDVDGFVLLTPDAFTQRQESGELFLADAQFCDYEGGYVDMKYIDVGFLEAAASHGSEAARSAFVGAQITFSRQPDLADLIATIPVYPEAERTQKMIGYVAQLEGVNWFMGEAEKRQNAYLRTWTAARTALFGYRLILAHNRILFPYHKWVQAYVADAPEKPDGMLDSAEIMLNAPSTQTVTDFTSLVLGFRQWPKPPQGWPARFLLDSEWNWQHGFPPIEDA